MRMIMIHSRRALWWVFCAAGGYNRGKYNDFVRLVVLVVVTVAVVLVWWVFCGRGTAGQPAVAGRQSAIRHIHASYLSASGSDCRVWWASCGGCPTVVVVVVVESLAGTTSECNQ
jgi:hypothetical protein